MFYDLAADGFSLDDKRTPIANNDLPDAISQWRAYQQLVVNNANSEAIEQQFGDKTQKAFVVDKADIASQKYDLSINLIKKWSIWRRVMRRREILRELKALEEAILVDLEELEAMLESQPIQERNGIPL